jgi:flagella basal body P-ring formation protein FlgA
MKPMLHRCLMIALLLACPALAAQETARPADSAARQDGAVVRQLVQSYLEQQTAGLPGNVSITVGPQAAVTKLAACPAPLAFQSPGARAWGKTTVGVRCAAPFAWTVYIQAQVTVVADYVAAAVPLAAGQVIDASQLVILQGDIAAMPNGIVTDPAQAVGRSPAISLPSGTPLRLDSLRSKPVVQQGQLVRVVSGGAGFRVSAEARAIGNAADGQVVQVRTPGGVVLSGVAKAGGQVEVAF